MGILDLAKSAVTSVVKDQLKDTQLGGYMNLATSLLDNNGQLGGLNGLVKLFDKANLSQVILSWIGKSANLPIQPTQVQQVLGSDLIGSFASQLGTNESTVLTSLTKLLPSIVDQATPDGSIPTGNPLQNLDLTKIVGSLLQ